ncbi:ABC transporter ATP-binding protein [Eggerthella sinensis]|uniref:ABC transporter ATP-binding protein n=1 Tax=Eggerthella sinensis TaxID=242230 RepID=UPI00266CF311|nr:ABC transporter ATP-binding protein [Eggerthella sinensis]
MSGTVLQVERLAYRYGKTEVFADVSFVLQEGEIALLTGPNGAGKSTMLRCLAGWDAPREGGVELVGKRFEGSDRAARRLVTFVPDVPSFYDDLTAGEHLRFVRQAMRLPASDDPSERLMERFDLDGQRDQLPSSYSRGMRQKLALVLAFARAPRLLLLDEPYGPLDPDAAVVLSELIDEACAAGTAVLASCHHDVPNLQPDLLLHLEGGRLAQRAARDEA